MPTGLELADRHRHGIPGYAREFCPYGLTAFRPPSGSIRPIRPVPGPACNPTISTNDHYGHRGTTKHRSHHPHSVGITRSANLDRFHINVYSHVLSDQLRLGAAATGDLTLLLTAIQVTSKFIATNVRKARLINLFVVSRHISNHPHIKQSRISR